MKKLGSSPGLVARYLRQQGGLGGAEFFLDKLNRFEAQSLVENRDAPPPSVVAETQEQEPDGYEALRAEALVCQKCGLSKTRTKVI